ncbi:hypothetical protein DMUE_4936 [Dictyocoela muelleri]|nr:hypothetical protein DMUE_4936 [Dictyocoela muelleri]
MYDQNTNREKLIFIKTLRNKEAIIYKQQFYYLIEDKSTVKKLRCYECKCRIKLLTEGKTIINENELYHTCDSLSNEQIKKIIGRNKIQKLAKNSFLNAKQIISE